MTSLIDELQQRPRPLSCEYARAVRVAAGVSQERLAEELGVHRVTVARWESGARRPTGAVLTAYLALLQALSSAATS